MEYKQGTVGNWLPIAANEFVCVGGGCGGMGEGGVVRILQSYGGDQVNLSYWRTKILLLVPPPPSPRWWIMTGPHLVIYSHIYFYSFILFIYLFIYSFILWLLFFSAKGEYQKELFYLTYLGSVPINLCLAFIWMRFGILLYREVRKKSERRVSHMWGTRHTAV